MTPTWDKVSHISFSARDADACAQWYEKVLGFRDFDHVEGPGWRGVLLLHAPTATVIEFQQHQGNDGSPFDPRRTGLDHLGLKVSSRDELLTWQDHFEQLGVDHTPVADRDYGSVLTFRDPDERQLEMFYREGHP